MNFKSLGAFGDFIGTISIEAQIHRGLSQIGEAVERTAKAEFGSYQPEVGPFEQWEELAKRTKRERVAKGYSENEPLLRSGELRDSISHIVDTRSAAMPGAMITRSEVVIGSTSQIMVYQELGTENIPPRPVLGPAVIHNEGLVKKIAGRAAVAGLLPTTEREKLYLSEIS